MCTTVRQPQLLQYILETIARAFFSLSAPLFLSHFWWQQHTIEHLSLSLWSLYIQSVIRQTQSGRHPQAYCRRRNCCTAPYNSSTLLRFTTVSVSSSSFPLLLHVSGARNSVHLFSCCWFCPPLLPLFLFYLMEVVCTFSSAPCNSTRGATATTTTTTTNSTNWNCTRLLHQPTNQTGAKLFQKSASVLMPTICSRQAGSHWPTVAIIHLSINDHQSSDPFLDYHVLLQNYDFPFFFFFFFFWRHQISHLMHLMKVSECLHCAKFGISACLPLVCTSKTLQQLNPTLLWIVQFCCQWHCQLLTLFLAVSEEVSITRKKRHQLAASSHLLSPLLIWTRSSSSPLFLLYWLRGATFSAAAAAQSQPPPPPNESSQAAAASAVQQHLCCRRSSDSQPRRHQHFFYHCCYHPWVEALALCGVVCSSKAKYTHTSTLMYGESQPTDAICLLSFLHSQ